MKPIKPKKLSKATEWWLRSIASGRADTEAIEPKHARAILSALEYERRRSDSARPLMTEAFLKAAEKVAYSPMHQRTQTEAVVPKPRAYGKCSCGHGHLSHDGEGKACLTLGCGCEKWRRG